MTGPVVIGIPAEPGARRCGDGRTEGGLYLESGLGVGGSPLEDFLMDPPVAIPADLAATLTKIGVTLVPGGEGRPHDVIDWVGSGHYPYASDFLEEGREKGFSRKVSPGLDFALLGPGSRLIFVHERGRVANHGEHTAEHLPGFACPTGNLSHGPGSDCTGLLYAHAPGETPGFGGRAYRAGAPGLPYPVGPLGPGAPAPVYQPAMIAALPLTNITLVTNGDGSHDEARRKAAEQSGFAVTLSPE